MRFGLEIPKDVSVVAFDWDGVIVDSVASKLRQNVAIAREFGNQISLDEARFIWRLATSLPEHLAMLTNGADTVAIEQVRRRDAHKPEFAKKRYEFALGKIDHLRQLGYRTAILTAMDSERFYEDAASLGISTATFDYIQTADKSEGYGKPDSRVFHHLINHFNRIADALPENIMYIGDEEKDFTAASGAGLHFIGVESGMASAGDFDTMGARHVPTLAEVYPYGTV